MKKYLSILSMALLALTSCEDVPAPYEINNQGGSSTTIFSESFSSSLGKFTNYTTSGAGAWVNDYSTAKATGYDNTAKTTTAGTYYLVSPEIDLTGIDTAYVTYDYIVRYNKGDENQQVLITSSFDATNPSNGWTILNQTHTEGADWSTFSNAAINVPSDFTGKKIRIALRYATNATSGSTWEVKNLKVLRGAVGEEPEPTPEPSEGLYYQSFASDLGGCKNYTTSGSGAWVIDYSTAKASGYDYSSKATTAGTYYLVTPTISLNGVDSAYVAYKYILRYNKADENQQILISTVWNEASPADGWTVLNQTHTEGADWTTFAETQVQIPAEYIGKTVRLAFRYNTNATSGSTWEVQSIGVYQGAVGTSGGDDPDDPDDPDPVPTGDNLIANGDFESWSGGTPIYWKSACSASKGTLAKSTDAHSGSASAKLAAGKQNQRLAYKEITLKAGTYYYSFYAKAGSAGGQVNPGYVPVENGTAGTYKYSGYVDVSNTEWTQVTGSFTLSATTQVCIVVMNPANKSSDIFFDDYTLTTTDGGRTDAEGGDDDPTTDPTDDSIPYSIDFTSTQGNWTIKDVNVPEGLNYIWKQNSTYGMKASAYYQQAYAGEAWLISPQFDLSGLSNVTLSLSHALNYLNSDKREDCIRSLISEDGNNWTDLELSAWPAGSDFNYVDATADLSKYAGKKIYIAFKYTSKSSNAVTYEIKTLSIK